MYRSPSCARRALRASLLAAERPACCPRHQDRICARPQRITFTIQLGWTTELYHTTTGAEAPAASGEAGNRCRPPLPHTTLPEEVSVPSAPVRGRRWLCSA